MIKKLMMLFVAIMAIIPMFGAIIDENWWPEWREDRDGDGLQNVTADGCLKILFL